MLVALDSNIFIAALSSKEKHSLNAQKLLRDISSRKNQATASSIVYGEIYSIHLSDQPLDLVDFFSHIDNLATVVADDNICLKAGELRLKYGHKLKLPDAMHLATALITKAELFITNDELLAKISQNLIPTKTLAQLT